MNAMTFRERGGQVAAVTGGMALLVGALDPMEGSVVILVGSALMALGAWLRRLARPEVAYRSVVFALVAVGVGALWGMSWFGGIGGDTGRSMWWGLTVAPYLVGWAMGLLGRNSPRWLLIGGVAVSVLYLAIPVLMIMRARHGVVPTLVPAFLIGALGVVTLAGCVYRLVRRGSREAVTG